MSLQLIDNQTNNQISNELVEKYFPAKDFSFEARKSIFNSIYGKLKSSMEPDVFMKRSHDINQSELQVIQEMAKLNFHTQIADFLGATRWLSYSEIDISNQQKPNTRELIYKSTLIKQVNETKSNAIAVASSLTIMGSNTNVIASAASMAKFCGIAVSTTALTSIVSPVVLTAGVAVLAFSLLYHKIPNTFFTKIQTTKLFPLNSVAQFDQTISSLEKDEESKKIWKENGIEASDIQSWVNTINCEKIARLMTKSTLKEVLELSFIHKQSLLDPENLNLNQRRDEIYQTITDRKDYSDTLGWMFVDTSIYVVNLWKKTAQSFFAMNELVRLKLEKYFDFGRLNNQDITDNKGEPNIDWLNDTKKKLNLKI